MAKKIFKVALHVVVVVNNLDRNPRPVEAQNVAGAVGLEVVHFHALPAPRTHRLWSTSGRNTTQRE